MIKTNINCPLQDECERKCKFVEKEKECDYYMANNREIELLPNELAEIEAEIDAELVTEETTQKAQIAYIPIEILHPHPDNPRFDVGDVSELAESIKVKGIMQNLTVVKGHYMSLDEYLLMAKSEGVDKVSAKGSYNQRECYSSEGYTVIIGHRRLAASKIAGLSELPCVITEMSLQEQVATMLLENMQRSDLTVYEQAQGFQLMLDFGESIESIAEKSGFSQTTVRRRVKLLDLDKDKFKNAEARGATLFDYMELDKIKSPELKNEVLETIGTPNFQYRLKQAISEEKDNEIIDEYEKIISTFAKSTTKDDIEGFGFEKSYGTYFNEDIKIPKDAETAEYRYVRSGRYISLYKKHDAEYSEKAEANKKAESERKQRIEELEKVSNRAYELRCEAIKAMSNSHIKKHLSVIMKYFFKFHIEEYTYFTGFNAGDFYEMLGFDDEYEDNGDFQYDLKKAIDDECGNKPERLILKVVYLFFDDNGRNNYYNYYGKFVQNKKLDLLYELLTSLGYEMSDEEKSLQNGTHDLFVKDVED